MANIYLTGAEIDAVPTTAPFYEYDSITGTAPTRTTTITKGSRAAYQFTTTPVAATSYIRKAVVGAETTNDYFGKFDLYVDLFSNTITPTVIFETLSGAGNRNLQIQLNTSRQIELLNYADAVLVTGPVLALDTWYTISWRFQYGAGGSTGYLYLDNALIGSGTVSNGATSNKMTDIIFGLIGQPSVTNTIAVHDNIIVNDSTGTNDNSFPDYTERVVHAYGVAGFDGRGGTNTYWATTAGGNSSGTINNYTLNNQNPPDDGANYTRRNAISPAGDYIDWYDIESVATINSGISGTGISSTDAVKVIQLGAQVGSGSGTPGNRFFKYRCVANSANVATPNASADVFTNVNGYAMMSVADTPGQYVPTAVFYTDETSSAWTVAKLDTMLIGLFADGAVGDNVRIPAIWAAIRYYTPAATTNRRLTLLGAGA